MNEIVQQVLNKADVIGQWLAGKIEAGVDYTTMQAIDIAMQYVAFGRVYHTAITVISFSLIVSCFVIAHKHNKKHQMGLEPFILAAMTSVIPLIVFCQNFKDAIMTWVAPKIWLMIQLTELVKAVK